MLSWRNLVLLALLTLPSSARADAISPPSPCPPGQDRGGGVLGGLGLWGHGGPPPCEPAMCRDASSCGPGQVCRRDAHCIEARTTRELRPSPGHGARLDPADPGSYAMVTRQHDLGRCEGEGRCPGESRCMMLATCRAERTDASPVVGQPREVGLEALIGPASVRGWGSAVPYDPALRLGPVGEASPSASPPPPPPPSPAAAAPAELSAPASSSPDPSSPPTSSAAPPPSSCACAAARRREPPLLPVFALLALIARRSAARPRRSRSTSLTRPPGEEPFMT